MATKKNDNNDIDTASKTLKIISDVVFIATMITFSLGFLMFALSVAQKITITVGK